MKDTVWNELEKDKAGLNEGGIALLQEWYIRMMSCNSEIVRGYNKHGF